MGKRSRHIGNCADAIKLHRRRRASESVEPQIINQINEFVAIVPTLLDITGLAPDNEMDGISLLAQPENRVIFGETSDSVFATDGAFKYVYYFEGGTEHLFHIEADPSDSRNLSGDTAFALRQENLKSRLIAYLQRNKRPCIVNDALRIDEAELDVDALRARNAAAWRGPLRYGDGYES